MATLKTYSPERVDTSWGGVELTGFAEGTAITLRRNTDNSAQAVGMQGDVGITKTANRTGQVEMVFMQTAETNRILSAVQAAQDLEDSDVIRGDIVITDPSGGMIALAQRCHIMTPPEVALGDDQSPKTWVWFAERIDFADTPAGFAASAGFAARVNAAVGTLKSASDAANQILN